MKKCIKKIMSRLGYKEYECPNCKRTNYLAGKDADGEIIAGYCRKCGHPVWFPILLAFTIMLFSCNTTSQYYPSKENRFRESFRQADSAFTANSYKLKAKSWQP
jgi:hypothetical protein